MSEPTYHFERMPRLWRGSQGAALTLSKRGIGMLSIAAYHAMGSPDAVEVLYDPAKTALAFRPVSPDAPDAFRLHPKRRQVSLLGWSQRYGFPLGQARRWAARRHEELLIIDLREAATIVGGTGAQH